MTGSGNVSQTDGSSVPSEESTTLFSSAASENESSYSYSSDDDDDDDDEYVSFPSEYEKYESYIRKRSEWSYVESRYMKRYARLPAPDSLYGCSYASNEDESILYSMSDWDSIVAYFMLIKSEGFNYEKVGTGGNLTMYNIFDESGDFLTGCAMSDKSPALMITIS